MKHGSLFSGIGGFDLAAQWMQWENVFHCEINPFCKKILKYYWPDAATYTDIKQTDFSIWRGKLDILTGGFPCQPFSAAGKRKGTEDDRHLWPEMLRAIREIKPRWIVGENVIGLVNWSGGLVFEQVQADLEAEGYEIQPFLLPACAVNAPHKRERVWLVAHSKGSEQKCSVNSWRGGGGPTDGNIFTSNAKSGGMEGSGTDWKQVSQTQAGQRLFGRNNTGGYWQEWPTQPPLCTGNDGISARLDGITFSKWRNESIKGAGNAVVPQVTYEIFKAISLFEKK